MQESLLILKVGEPPAVVAQEFGAYERWFLWRLEGMSPALPTVVHDMRLGPPEGLPAALLITGAPESLHDPLPWLPEARQYLKRAIAAGVPMLGVCFGHQLLCELLGGTVGPNPRGWELGTAEISLTPDGLQDPLFEGLNSPLYCHETHRDVVLELPPGAIVLAQTALDPHHALRLRERVWSVQFHPEMRAMHVGAVIASYAPRLHNAQLDLGLKRGELVLEALKSMKEEDDGAAILQRFLNVAVG